MHDLDSLVYIEIMDSFSKFVNAMPFYSQEIANQIWLGITRNVIDLEEEITQGLIEYENKKI